MLKNPKSLLAVPLFLALAATAASAATVTIDGAPVTLNPPPIERAGRIFVPLRGVFEQLGASVVYQGGTINATGNSATISLHVGSTAANVSGAAQTLDVAPFIVGSSTYVPLRFVAQALGAHVSYDGSNQVVAIRRGGAGQIARAPEAARETVHLRDLEPADGATVSAIRPTIQADFSEHVDPNTVRVVLDGLDVTSQTTRSETGIVFAPPSPLQPTNHHTVVSGTDRRGQPFERAWDFVSGTEMKKNQLEITRLSDGSSVGGTFTVDGHTVPNARVHLVAGAVAQVGARFAMGTGNYTGDTIADDHGNFSQQVSVNTLSGGTVTLTVTSTDPSTHGTAQRTLHLHVS